LRLVTVRRAGAELKKPFGIDGAVPTFIIESRSISQSRSTMLDTMAVWMEAGVREAWLVDPIVVDYRRLKTGREVDVLPNFGTVDIYVRDPTTGSYTVETYTNQPASVSSFAGLPGFEMDFRSVWNAALDLSRDYIVYRE
jgi:Uma2 family endonuclease